MIDHFEDILDYGYDRFDGKIVKAFNDKIHAEKEEEITRKLELAKWEANKRLKEKRRATYEKLKKEFEGE